MPDDTPLSPASRYRLGARDDPEARAAHSQASREWRRENAEAEFPQASRTRLLAACTQGTPLDMAAREVNVKVTAVWGRCRWDEEFAAALETALAANCPGGDRCGTDKGYKQGGRCARCRRAHRGGKAPTQTMPDGLVFGLVDEPWIQVRQAGSDQDTLVSLRAALLGGHDIIDLAYGDPTVTIAVHRLLAAVVHAALDAPGGDPAGWASLWAARRLPAEPVGRWLDEHAAAFDLFGRAPFAQCAVDAPGGPRPVSYLTLYAPQGAGVGFFFQPPQELTAAEAAAWLLHCHAYDTGGIRTGHGGGRETGVPSGTLSVGTQIRLVGASLTRTLLLAQVPELAGGRGWWDRPQQPGRRRDRVPAGGLDWLCWPARAIRLVPDPDGMVRSAVITAGDDPPKDSPDPFGEPHWKDQDEALSAPYPQRLVGIFCPEGKIATPPVVAALRRRLQAGHMDAADPVRVELAGVQYNKWRSTVQDVAGWRSAQLTAAHLDPATAAGQAAAEVVQDGLSFRSAARSAIGLAATLPTTRVQLARQRGERILMETWAMLGQQLGPALAGTGDGWWAARLNEEAARVADALETAFTPMDMRVGLLAGEKMRGVLAWRVPG